MNSTRVIVLNIYLFYSIPVEELLCIKTKYKEKYINKIKIQEQQYSTVTIKFWDAMSSWFKSDKTSSEVRTNDRLWQSTSCQNNLAE